jgi:hypothetical protein
MTVSNFTAPQSHADKIRAFDMAFATFLAEVTDDAEEDWAYRERVAHWDAEWLRTIAHASELERVTAAVKALEFAWSDQGAQAYVLNRATSAAAVRRILADDEIQPVLTPAAQRLFAALMEMGA